MSNLVFDVAAPGVRSVKNRLGVDGAIAELRRVERETLEETRIGTWGEGYPQGREQMERTKP